MRFPRRARFAGPAAVLGVLLAGLLLPQQFVEPVEGMRHPGRGSGGKGDYDLESFWYHPWGESVTHKGVDIFAGRGTAVRSATGGIVVATGSSRRGGNVVMILGPKWRFHYYAHLDTVETRRFARVEPGTRIGTVGNTGNAIGRPCHLHYVILTAMPYPWRWDGAPQGWRKMFYLDPTAPLQETAREIEARRAGDGAFAAAPAPGFTG